MSKAHDLPAEGKACSNPAAHSSSARSPAETWIIKSTGGSLIYLKMVRFAALRPFWQYQRIATLMFSNAAFRIDSSYSQ
jgi:hypothetical protein